MPTSAVHVGHQCHRHDPTHRHSTSPRLGTREDREERTEYRSRMVELRRVELQNYRWPSPNCGSKWSEWVIRFDRDLSLHISIEEREVCWSLKPSSEVLTDGGFERVGAPAVVLNWINTIGLREMDRSSLVAKRRGARFKDPFVGDHGFCLYLHDRLILKFG
jgi:hypothetical protein